MRYSFLILNVFLILCAPSYGARLLGIEVKQQGNHPSILFTLDKPVPHKVFTLTNPNRVVIDFERADLGINLNQINLGRQLIKYIRSGHPDSKTLRLVFEVDQAVITQVKSFNKPTNHQHGFELDLSTYAKSISSTGIKEKPKVSIPRLPEGIKTAPIGRRKVIVILDPGHGGKDPGASGPRRSLEKNVTLAIAQKLKQIIDRQPGMQAVLTRTGDYYIELRQRLKIARKYNGDVFVSIHADAFINQNSSGASVFALSQSGATSEAARWLAEKENYSELGGVNLSQLDDQSGLVRTVLIDLSQTATIGASLHMGERVLSHLNRITALHNQKVEQARFMVLKSPDIPSILIETGFISNPREERNLTNAAYQVHLTKAIFEGLKNYFWEYPPHGTQIEALVGNNNFHLVQQGESLNQIAAHYHIAPLALKQTNRLKSNQIRPGQRLMIPTAIS